jgi:enamine deaminase RidA (YjgF/YER057c/UK114 family)
LPSRTCIGSNGLAVGALLEIDLIVGLTESEIA